MNLNDLFGTPPPVPSMLFDNEIDNPILLEESDREPESKIKTLHV